MRAIPVLLALAVPLAACGAPDAYLASGQTPAPFAGQTDQAQEPQPPNSLPPGTATGNAGPDYLHMTFGAGARH